jgi:glycerol uptake facilitator-like aquaporin
VLAVGLRPGVDIYAGAAGEFVLCFLLSFTGLLSEDAPSRRAPAGRALVCRGCRSRQGELARGSLPPPARRRFLRFWVPLLAVVLAVRAGESYTGPCLNPVMALSWNLSYRWQSSAEHAVFWVANLCAAMFAGWSYLGCKQFAQERLAGRRPLGRLRPKAD